MTTLDTVLTVEAISTFQTALDLVTASTPLRYRKEIDLTDGTGANKADRIFHDTRTLAASTTENIDLAGSLVDVYGATITFARIKALIVAGAAANTNNVQVGGAAANAFINWVADATDIINVRPGGLMVVLAPDATAYAVTAATG